MPCVNFCHTFKKQKDMKGKIIDYMEMAQGARYGIEKESDRLTERLTQMEDYRKLLDGIDEVIADNKRQQEEIESLQLQLTEEKRQRAELEMKLTELNKLTAGVAKKAEEETLLKVLRTYVNRSKKKTSDKRAYIKSVVLEIAMQNGLTLPDDMADTIDNLDDEQTEPRTVVNGDLVQNKHVENEIDKVEPGATGITINKKQS